MKIYVTEQNPKKLGETIDLFQEEDRYSSYQKMDFSCSGCRDLIIDLKKSGISNLLICGIETHICVLQSSFDLSKESKNIHLVVDAVGSRNEVDHKTAIKRLEKSVVTLTTTETAIFELCKSAEAKEFKKISSIIKRQKVGS